MGWIARRAFCWVHFWLLLRAPLNDEERVVFVGWSAARKDVQRAHRAAKRSGVWASGLYKIQVSPFWVCTDMYPWDPQLLYLGTTNGYQKY